MLVGLLYDIGKYFLYFFIAYFVWLVYLTLVRPFIFWYKFKKFPNVYVDPTFRPIIGDLWYHLQCVKEGRAHYKYMIDKAPIFQNYDLRVLMEGVQPVILLVSGKAVEQFCSMQPVKIDRTNDCKGLSKAAPNGYAGARTTKVVRDRRKLLTSLLNLSRASSYIPGILDCLEESIKTFKYDKEQNFEHAIGVLIFKIITNCFFGDDVHEATEKLTDYQNPDGNFEKIPIREFFIRLPKDYLMQLYNPCTTMFPWLNKYNLLNPYKRDHENLHRFKAALREVLATSKDEKSIWGQVKNVDWYDKEALIDDLNTFTIGGFENSSKVVVTTLYHLKKFPETLVKLKKELEENGFTKDANPREVFDIDKIQNLDYLANVIKEAMRIDSPAIESFAYSAYEDIEICGVPLPKGN